MGVTSYINKAAIERAKAREWLEKQKYREALADLIELVEKAMKSPAPARSLRNLRLNDRWNAIREMVKPTFLG